MVGFYLGNCLCYVWGSCTDLRLFAVTKCTRTTWLRKGLFLQKGQLRSWGEWVWTHGLTSLAAEIRHPPLKEACTASLCRQCIPPPPKAGIWGSSDESRSRNACFLAVIIQKVWMSSSSAAIWRRKDWLHDLESRKSRLYFLLVSHFGWHSKATEWTKAERHPDSVPGRRFVSCSQSPGLKGCTRHNAVKNQTQEPPSKSHSSWAPASAIHPKH